MPKLPECNHCLLYAQTPYLVCAVHPNGIECEHCPDFQPDANTAPEVLWEPMGASYYNGELNLPAGCSS